MRSTCGRRRSSPSWWLNGVLLLLLVCLSACASTESAAVPSDTELTIGVPESNVDGTELGVGQLARTVTLEGLTQLSAEGRALPRLAESWTWGNGDMELRLQLRKNITLHDGRRLDAQFVAEALAAAAAVGSNRAGYPALVDLRGAIPQGPTELLLELATPSPLLPDDLTMLLDIPAGPYRKTGQTGAKQTFERFENYYQGLPSIPRMTIEPVDTLRNGWARLLRGELDMVYDVSADAVEFVRNEDIDVVSVPRWYQYQLTFNSAKAPLNSPAVRRALNMAIDRRRLVEKVLNGRGEPAAGPLYPKYWAYDPTVPEYPFDPAGAAAILEEAGYPVRQTSDKMAPSRLRFTCLLPQNFTVWERMALEVQRDLIDIGVDMQFKVVPFTEFNEMIGTRQFEAALIDMISGPTPARIYTFWRSAREFRGRNVFGYENVEAERLFTTVMRSRNDAAVRSATSRLQRVLRDDPPALFLAWDTRVRAVSRRFVLPDDSRDPILTLWKWSVRRSDVARAQ